ncbi:MAG TPA: hypothetical protein VKT77_00170, partial [Chthonomonadaceae bacterium]|nr:hypothetical protein [Chthonomonadaceae bacterium]
MDAVQRRRLESRFRLGVLLLVLVLVGVLFLMLRLQRADAQLRDAVIQNDIEEARSALQTGADPNLATLPSTEPNALQKLLNGQNPFTPSSSSAGPTGQPVGIQYARRFRGEQTLLHHAA